VRRGSRREASACDIGLLRGILSSEHISPCEFPHRPTATRVASDGVAAPCLLGGCPVCVISVIWEGPTPRPQAHFARAVPTSSLIFSVGPRDLHLVCYFWEHT